MSTTPLTLDDVRGRATISVAEAAQILGIVVNQAYAAVDSGQVEALRFGRSIRVSVPRLLASLGDTPREPAPPQRTWGVGYAYLCTRCLDFATRDKSQMVAHAHEHEESEAR